MQRAQGAPSLSRRRRVRRPVPRHPLVGHPPPRGFAEPEVVRQRNAVLKVPSFPRSSGSFRLVLAAWLSVAGVATMAAHDWPQFLGPSRDGVYSGTELADSWPAAGPRRVWTKQVGQGFSGPVVTGDRVILFHRVENDEVIEALDARTGRTEWTYEYPTAYRDDFGFDEGPRAVPVVADGRVYTFGAQGQLHAVDLETGAGIWNVDTQRRYRVRKGWFGAAGSPLVEGGRVLANIGGPEAGIVAFDAETGAELWTATRDQAGYSSGVGATFDGERYAVFYTRDGLRGLDPATGRVGFQFPLRSRLNASVSAATPLIARDLIFLSATYGVGAITFRVEGTELVELWSSGEVMSNHYATTVHHDGYLYGYHGRQEYNPSFRAVELRTGRVQWSEDRFRAGTVTVVGEHLLILRETGELILADASPTEFRPIARAQILNPVVRAYPALADGYLYARNEDTLACFDLRK